MKELIKKGEIIDSKENNEKYKLELKWWKPE